MNDQILEKILSGIEEIKKEQKVTNDRLDVAEDKLNRIEIRIDSVEKRLNKIEHKLDTTVEQTARLSEYHAETTDKLNNLATKEDLTYIDTELGKHNREIFKLKNA